MAQEETEAIAADSASAEAAALTSSPKKDSCSNDTSQSQFTQHTTLFDPMTVQNEYYESYSNMTIDASSSSTAPAASLTTSNNNRNVWLRRFRASNNNTNNSNTRGGVHLFTMMRGGGTVATSTNTSTRRR